MSEEMELLQLAKVLNGPFYALPADSKYTLDHLRELRWEQSGRHLQAMLLQQARAANEWFKALSRYPDNVQGDE